VRVVTRRVTPHGNWHIQRKDETTSTCREGQYNTAHSSSGGYRGHLRGL